MNPIPTNRHHRGFTLLEVLVALLIVALALTAMIRATGISATAQSVVRDQQVARWVADNAVTQLLLDEQYPATGRRTGSERMAQQVWNWDLLVSDTDVAGLRRINVSVDGAEFDYFAGQY